MARCLEGNQKSPPTEDTSILGISTYGRDKQLTDTVACLEKNCEKLKFKYVKKTAPSLKNLLTNGKLTALGSSFGPTMPCGRKRCKSCQLMSGESSLLNQKKNTKTAEGTCLSRLLIYHATCMY